jgi:hypothetical protein
VWSSPNERVFSKGAGGCPVERRAFCKFVTPLIFIALVPAP